MQNVAEIEIDSPPYWQHAQPEERFYPPTRQQLDFACELCRTLGRKLEAEGLDCAPPRYHPQFGGAASRVLVGEIRFSINVSVEPKPGAKTNIILWVEPCFGLLSQLYPPARKRWLRCHKQDWIVFEDHLHRAVKSQFQGCPLKWMRKMNGCPKRGTSPCQKPEIIRSHRIPKCATCSNPGS